ncbi:hypothetical protein CG370_08150 [Campylobacter upsaliensis]|nr:hypothetical protein [Campylobacter upsaliensis]EAJ3606332.1 hypothetical protein [Campylobacter upsaliensis]
MERIDNLDLEPIIVKIMDKVEGKGWELSYTQLIEAEYRKFLLLMLKYPNEAIVPPQQVDEFWHYHILDTMKYEKDCKDIFGYFVHHFPYFGMRGKDDESNLKTAWNRTCELYIYSFGEPTEYIRKHIWTSAGRCPNCGRRSPEANVKFAYDARPTISVC